MFERFTDRARRSVVLAQEEARILNHNYIGTEHLLLGLVHEETGVAGQVIGSFDITLEQLRQDVEDIIGRGTETPKSHIPFTPRAKRCLELSLREALQLGNNYIGTEHVLLGLLREGEGVAMQILTLHGISAADARMRVVEKLKGYEEMSASVAVSGVALGASAGSTLTAEALAEEGAHDPKCPNCKRASLIDTAAFKTIQVSEDGGPGHLTMRVVYCEACGIAIASMIFPDDAPE